MSLRLSCLIGIAVMFSGITLSILLAPWFSFYDNALSDLGHSTKSVVAPIFNFNLICGGTMLLVYGLSTLRHKYLFTGYIVSLASFFLILVGAFDEVYGLLHFAVSAVFFILMGLASITYSIESGVKLGYIAFVAGILGWLLFWLKVYRMGIAVPELVSAVAVSTWILYDFVKTR